ncbi:MAG TPA: hypothetical protein PK020_18230 [Ilumatobacteraceae bacterium]|nr:hypothetical protein [Ilumatobacteraceae bacterium]
MPHPPGVTRIIPRLVHPAELTLGSVDNFVRSPLKVLRGRRGAHGVGQQRTEDADLVQLGVAGTPLDVQAKALDLAQHPGGRSFTEPHSNPCRATAREHVKHGVAW